MPRQCGHSHFPCVSSAASKSHLSSIKHGSHTDLRHFLSEFKLPQYIFLDFCVLAQMWQNLDGCGVSPFLERLCLPICLPTFDVADSGRERATSGMSFFSTSGMSWPGIRIIATAAGWVGGMAGHATSVGEAKFGSYLNDCTGSTVGRGRE